MERIEESLFVTLETSSLSELEADIADVCLDQLLTDGPLKDIPFFATLQKSCAAFKSITNYFYAKKVSRFLLGFKHIPPDERAVMMETLNLDEDQRKRFGETTLMILDKVTDLGKPGLMANACIACFEQKITFDQLMGLYHAIETICPDAIAELKTIYDNNLFSNARWELSETTQHLAHCGLGIIDFLPASLGHSDRPWSGRFEGGVLGYLFYRYVLKGTKEFPSPPTKPKPGSYRPEASAVFEFGDGF